MTGKRTINLATGLPATVNTDDPKELRRVLNRVLEVIRVWNGEAGDPGERVLTAKEQ